MIKTITQFIKNKRKATIILIILLLLLIPINVSYINSITHENYQTHREKEATAWLKEYDSNYKQENISSDRGVAISWYLRKYTYTTIPRVLNATNETLENKLNSINAKYYIDSTSNLTNISNYHVIYSNKYKNQELKIYERN